MRDLSPPPSNLKPKRTFQGYQRRSPEIWRAARGDALDKATMAWLTKLLNAADRSVTLSDWEASFVLDTQARFLAYGRSTRISPKQRAILERLAERLGVS
jgi:hypothetical protein